MVGRVLVFGFAARPVRPEQRRLIPRSQPLGLDDTSEGAVTGLDGKYPVKLRFVREAVARSEWRVALDREPFAAVREDQHFVEHVSHGSAAFGWPPGPLTGEIRPSSLKER